MKKRQYSGSTMQKALKFVLSKKGSIREAARRYGVPRSSIQFKITHPHTKCASGPSTILTESEESTLADFMLSLDRRGFPRKKKDIQISAQKILLENPRKNPFRNNCPNAGWFTAFVRRHPEISAPGVTTASFAEDDIKAWYKCIRKYLCEEKLFCVITDPKRLYKTDETSFKVCSDTGKMLTDYGVPNANNLTVLFSFSASGLVTNPMLIFPMNIPENTTETMPMGWGVSCSPTGKISSDGFYHYIENVLHPDLTQKKINFPIILFVDCKTPVTLDVSELCKKLDIHLIAMYPQASHIQAVVSQSLKTSWRKGLRTLYQTPLTSLNFASLFENVFNDLTNSNVLIEAFHKLGLFPFEEENIDCSKEAIVLRETIEVIENDSEDNIDCTSEDEDSNNFLESNLSVTSTDQISNEEDTENTIIQISQDRIVEDQKLQDINTQENQKIEPESIKFDLLLAKLESPICDICMGNITGTILECCECFNYYHPNCIPNFDKNNLSLKQFTCHMCN